jgi:predicted TIM-barrel fold metal-dependent hydrolase
VPDWNGRRRSFALPEFDRFWKRVEEADLLVGMHASDSGTQRYVNEFEGRDGEFLPFGGITAFVELLGAEYRIISDVVASIIGHGMATRFPKLRILPVENGSAWVRPLIERLEKVYSRKPGLFDEDPVAVFKRNIWVHPFHEEDPTGLIDLVGVENVCFGSDYPHPEGLYDPLTYVDELASLSKADQAKVMGGNLAEIMRVG